MMEAEVIVVGAGLAGLACAMQVARAGRNVLVLEAAPQVGGRLRTTEVEGFQLDHGFQVLLTAYPGLDEFLDLDALKLGSFEPGARLWHQGQFHVMADPIRRPSAMLAGLRCPVGTMADKLRVLELRRKLSVARLEDIFVRPEMTTEQRLRADGYTEGFIDQFFRSFYGGIFLERELKTSSRMFEFLFKMFGEGLAAIPAGGIQQIPLQMASHLSPGSLRLNQKVVSIRRGEVEMQSGEKAHAHLVVVATDGPNASTLLKGQPDPGSRAATCWYFEAPVSPVDGRWLCLDGDGRGPVNHLCVVSNVAADCAPAGRHLISLSLLGNASSVQESEVRAQMKSWFGSQVESWRELSRFVIPHAHPDLPQMHVRNKELAPEVAPGLFVCGDWTATASIHGALSSGRKAATAALAALAAPV